jgi:hypothetical protein
MLYSLHSFAQFLIVAMVLCIYDVRKKCSKGGSREKGRRQPTDMHETKRYEMRTGVRLRRRDERAYAGPPTLLSA